MNTAKIEYMALIMQWNGSRNESHIYNDMVSLVPVMAEHRKTYQYQCTNVALWAGWERLVGITLKSGIKKGYDLLASLGHHQDSHRA